MMKLLRIHRLTKRTAKIHDGLKDCQRLKISWGEESRKRNFSMALQFTRANTALRRHLEQWQRIFWRSSLYIHTKYLNFSVRPDILWIVRVRSYQIRCFQKSLTGNYMILRPSNQHSAATTYHEKEIKWNKPLRILSPPVAVLISWCPNNVAVGEVLSIPYGYHFWAWPGRTAAWRRRSHRWSGKIPPWEQLPSGYVKIAMENDHWNSGFSH